MTVLVCMCVCACVCVCVRTHVCVYMLYFLANIVKEYFTSYVAKKSRMHVLSMSKHIHPVNTKSCTCIQPYLIEDYAGKHIIAFLNTESCFHTSI